MTAPGNPFYATAWFNLSANYNEPDEFVTLEGIAQRIETFKHRMLPTEYDIDKRFTDNLKDRYAVAAYPRCSVFTLNGREHVRHSYAMVYFCASNPPDDMNWQPEGKSFPQSENRSLEIDRPEKGKDDDAGNDGGADSGSGNDSGPDTSAIIAHCDRYKITQPASNAGHHVRWDTAKRMVNEGNYGAAISYAEQWCGRGWKPWCELITKLKEIVKR